MSKKAITSVIPAVLGAALLTVAFMPSTAAAHTDVSLGINLGGIFGPPVVAYAPPVVNYAPPVVNYVPVAPYYAPPPTVYYGAPRVIYSTPGYAYVEHGWRGRGYWNHGNWQRWRHGDDDDD